MSTTAERYTPEFYLANQRSEKAHTMAMVALVRAQEKEKERNYVMRWVRDPEDHTLWRWLPIKPRKKTKKQ